MSEQRDIPATALRKMDELEPILRANGADMTGWESIRVSLEFSHPATVTHTHRLAEWLRNRCENLDTDWKREIHRRWMSLP